MPKETQDRSGGGDEPSVPKPSIVPHGSDQGEVWRDRHQRHQRRLHEREGRESITEENLVSVVITCYNHGHFLGDAIESVIAQTYAPVEIIVVDDGSNDDTREQASRYPGVRYVWQDNQGLSAARNTGLRYSSGAFVVFLDADDRLLRDALAVGHDWLTKNPDWAFVSGLYRMVTVDWEHISNGGRVVERDHYRELLRTNYIGMHATVMYRRTALEAVGGFDTSLRATEDYAMYLRIARTHPVGSHGELIAEYRQHGSNMSRDPVLMLTTALTVLRAEWPYVKDDVRNRRAYREGIRFWQGFWGVPLARLAFSQVRRGEWQPAFRNTWIILRHAPWVLFDASRRFPRYLRHRWTAPRRKKRRATTPGADRGAS